jgi:hypothetical protein
MGWELQMILFKACNTSLTSMFFQPQQPKNACINSELFMDQTRCALLLHLSNPREQPELGDEAVVLLLNNCLAHFW